jgi:Na+/H+ antiporter NhaB
MDTIRQLVRATLLVSLLPLMIVYELVDSLASFMMCLLIFLFVILLIPIKIGFTLLLPYHIATASVDAFFDDTVNVLINAAKLFYSPFDAK